MKFLIVDDELLIRRSIGRLLSKKGHQIFEAEDGKEALVKWCEVKPEVVLLDFLMPKMNGLEVLREVSPDLKKHIFIMSAYVGQNEEKDFINLGAKKFFSKPFEDIFKFIEEVESLIHT